MYSTSSTTTQPRPAHPFGLAQLVLERAAAPAEQRHPFGGGAELDAPALEAGPDRDRDREVGLAGAGAAPSSTTFSRASRKSSWAEVLDHLAADRALESGAELLERVAGRLAGGADARDRK